MSFLERGQSLAYGVHHTRGTVRIHIDMTGAFTGCANKDNLSKSFAKHPAEVMIQETEKEEDVECSLMVGNKDVFGFLVDILATFDGHWTEGEAYDATCPNDSRPIAPEVLVAKPASKNRCKRGKNGYDDEEWHKDEPLIHEIQNFHIIIDSMSEPLFFVK